MANAPAIPPLDRALFRVATVLFVAAALFHAFHAFVPDEAPPSRHLVFVVIDLAFASAVHFRPPGVAVAFALLTGQQLASHGTSAWRAIRASAAFPWLDLGVLLFLFGTTALLVRDARRRKKAL